MSIVVVGRGSLAQRMLELLPSIGNAEVFAYKKDLSFDKNTFFIHVGSGKELPEIIQLAKNLHVPLVQASTGIPVPKESLSFPYIEAPNLSLPLIQFMRMMKNFGANYAQYKVELLESHQASKKTLPGTAAFFANCLSLPVEKIKSIRDQKFQKENLHIQDEFINAHAYHQITISTQENVELQFTTRVYGRDTYAHGAWKLFLCREKLPIGVHLITDLMDLGLL